MIDKERRGLVFAGFNEDGEREFIGTNKDWEEVEEENCFECEGTGEVSQSNGPDDFDIRACHCRVLEKLELQANA